MEIKKSLNTDVPGKISELQAMMKEFILKHKLYRILIRGKGLEFETFRDYAPDDDSTSIDWRASKRANKTLVKQYRDERNLKILFIVDAGENMVSGSSEKLKCEYTAEVVASFAHLIITTGDKVGSIVFSDEIKDYRRPMGGTRNFHQFVDTLISPDTYGGASDLNKAIEFALTYVKGGVDSVVIVSDFTSFNQESNKGLSLLAEKYETLAIIVRDPIDRRLPNFSGEVVLQDPKTGQQLLIDPRVAGHAYEKFSLEQENFVKKSCSRNDVDVIELMTNEPFVPALAEFLKERIRKKEGI